MTGKRPKPRDIREKEQQIRKREKDTQRSELKHLRPRCPHCDKTSMEFYHSETLRKMIIYCKRCFCGDCVEWKVLDENVYYHKFVDSFRNAWKTQKDGSNQVSKHYFNGKIYPGPLKDFKRQIMEGLEEMVMRVHREHDGLLLYGFVNMHVKLPRKLEIHTILSELWIVLKLSRNTIKRSVRVQTRRF